MLVAGNKKLMTSKASAALYGLAIGDALGMPSQTLNRDTISKRYGTINDFMPPFPGHPVSNGLEAAQVTDDTEQTVLLARRLIDEPDNFDEKKWAQDLLDWEKSIQQRGLFDLLGPSSKRAVEAIRKGLDPEIAGKKGTTNGAAMRITPVGIVSPSSDLERLIDLVEITCRATHNTSEAIAAAAAVAGYISHRIDGADHKAALSFSLAAAEMGESRGYPCGVQDVAGRITHAVLLAETGVSADAFADVIGTSVASYEAVPAAFGIMSMAMGDVWCAGLLAANIGDDTDTIGSIACAMCGAGSGMEGLNQNKIDELNSANDLDFDALSVALVDLRQGIGKLIRREAS